MKAPGAPARTSAAAIEEDCTFDSFEACRRLVIQGNRGFCTQNPAFIAGYRRAAAAQEEAPRAS